MPYSTTSTELSLTSPGFKPDFPHPVIRYLGLVTEFSEKIFSAIYCISL
jgi:hypothetical protein